MGIEDYFKIEPFAYGFIIAQYGDGIGRYGAKFFGKSLRGRSQPIIDDPFDTKEDAEASLAKQKETKNDR